jgi:F0F1-type ATP synthase membrane subunit c/vacuolar-type H+-ATPase subunit K
MNSCLLVSSLIGIVAQGVVSAVASASTSASAVSGVATSPSSDTESGKIIHFMFLVVVVFLILVWFDCISLHR